MAGDAFSQAVGPLLSGLISMSSMAAELPPDQYQGLFANVVSEFPADERELSLAGDTLITAPIPDNMAVIVEDGALVIENRVGDNVSLQASGERATRTSVTIEGDITVSEGTDYFADDPEAQAIISDMQASIQAALESRGYSPEEAARQADVLTGNSKSVQFTGSVSVDMHDQGSVIVNAPMGDGVTITATQDVMFSAGAGDNLEITEAASIEGYGLVGDNAVLHAEEYIAVALLGDNPQVHTAGDFETCFIPETANISAAEAISALQGVYGAQLETDGELLVGEWKPASELGDNIPALTGDICKP